MTVIVIGALSRARKDSAMPVPVTAESRLTGSWVSEVDLALIREQVGTPAFVYSEPQLTKNLRRIKDAAAKAGLEGRVELYIPFFPNSNPHLLRSFQDLGVGILLQLPGEHKILQQFGFDKFIVSPGHVSDDEIGYWARTGYPTFLSSLGEVKHLLSINAPSISVRIDSLDSGKPGIKLGELDHLTDLLSRYGRDLECFEVYCGSGNSLDDMIGGIERQLDIFGRYFPSARSINFAGGHGFAYEDWDEDEKHFAWLPYLSALSTMADRMRIPRRVKFLFEPARDVLADVGVLLLGVKRDIVSNSVGNLVVTDGTRMLMPSAQLRDRRHNIVFLDDSMTEIPQGDPATEIEAAVRGRTILRNDYILPGEYRVPGAVTAGSHMLVMDVGAYCATQHMEFLNVPPAAEVLVDAAGDLFLTSAAGGDLDHWRNLLPVRKKLMTVTGAPDTEES
jgi:diaminopimelate decarboxylase